VIDEFKPGLRYIAEMTKLLFVCNQGENRSRTGKELFEKLGFDTEAAGIYSDHHPLTAELLSQADKVFVFEQEHVDFIKAHWPALAWEKPIFNLEIKDKYCYGNRDLERVMREKIREWL